MGDSKPRIVQGPKEKHATCKDCGSVIAYLPEHVERREGHFMGDPDGDERVKCPRPGCSGYAIIKVW